MADEARLNELLDLVEQARAEHDTATEAKAVAAYRRESAPAAPAAPPMLAQPNPAEQSTWGGAIKNVGEAALKFGTGMFSTPIANAAGLASIPADMAAQGVDEDTQARAAARGFPVPAIGQRVDPAAVKARVADTLTYQPSNPGSLSSRIVDAPGAAIRWSGEQLAKPVKGIPYLETFAENLPEAGANALGIKAARIAGRAPKEVPQPIPTTAELRTATSAAYKRGEESGVMVPAEQFAKAADEIAANAKNEALDPVLHPKSSRVIQVLQERKGQNLTMQEAENLRRIALDAEGDVNNIGQQTRDGNIAGNIVDDLDEKIDALSVNDEARALNRRKMNSQLLDWMIEKATNNAGAHYTQAGMEHALRLQFKQLANNARRIKRFSADEKAAIQKVARGGPLENTLRTLGKFDPTSGVIPALATAATGGTLAGVGFLSRRAATRATVKNVDAAREALVGRGLPEAPQAAAPAAAQPLSGELMPRPPLALPPPTIISGPRSAPGSMYARQQIGMTPDVEMAGMQHPGMARQSVPRPRPALPYIPETAAADMVVDAQGRAAPTVAQLNDYLRTSRQQGAATRHPGTAREGAPRQPLALPHIPDQPGPMVVDQAGRVAPSMAQLNDYLANTGQKGLRNVRQPAARPGLLEGEPKPAPQAGGLLGEKSTRQDVSRRTSARPRRSSTAILADIHLLRDRARFELAQEPAGSPKVKAFSQELARLQDELASTDTKTPK